MKKHEIDFKRSLRAGWKAAGFWSEAYEPGKGSGVGYADLQLLVGGNLVPVELKVGELRGSRIGIVDEIRPSQVRWHWDLWRNGGKSALVVGVPYGKDLWQIWARRGSPLGSWREGFDDMLLVQNMSQLFSFLQGLRSAS